MWDLTSSSMRAFLKKINSKLYLVFEKSPVALYRVVSSNEYMLLTKYGFEFTFRSSKLFFALSRQDVHRLLLPELLEANADVYGIVRYRIDLRDDLKLPAIKKGEGILVLIDRESVLRGRVRCLGFRLVEELRRG